MNLTKTQKVVLIPSFILIIILYITSLNLPQNLFILAKKLELLSLNLLVLTSLLLGYFLIKGKK